MASSLEELNESSDIPDAQNTIDLDVVQMIRQRLNDAIKGKKAVIEHLITGLFSGSHILFDDLPGLGKTTLGKSIAQLVGGSFGRLQGTPDLLPSDVTGFNIFDRKTQDFVFRPGPVFSDVLLVDEINRATPRTQSSLFEAMAERQTTIDGKSFALAKSFFVIATQNPVDHQGTFQLPEAQLDRFGMVLRIGYPDEDAEMQVLQEKATQTNEHAKSVKPLITPEILHNWQNQVASVHVDSKISHYLVRIAKHFRESQDFRSGLSPRGLITLQRVAQTRAILNGRNFVTPEDVQDVAIPVLSVRFPGDLEETRQKVEQSIQSIPCPKE